MIIDPDFFEHWKTKALIELTKRPESPLWLQRLWAHCQTRKTWEFRGLSSLALKSICGVPADITPDDWKQHLVDANFVKVKGEKIIVHDWEKHNASLVQRWNSGKIPKKKREPSGEEAEHKPQTSDREDRYDRVEGYEWMEGKTAAQAAEIIYNAYPRQVGKQAALKAILKALSWKGPVALLRKTEEYSRATINFEPEDRQFIPHPATWFNAGRYEDDPMEWRRPEKNFAGGGAPATGPHAHTGGLEVFEPVTTAPAAAQGGVA